MDSNEGTPGHLGVQLVASLLARSTTQTAIVLGAGMGCLPRQKAGTSAEEAENLFRFHAGAEMLGVLRTSLVRAEIVDMGSDNRAEAEKLWRPFNRLMKTHLDRGLRKDDSLKVDLVLTPIDGAGALSGGLSGSVSVAAAGGAGCFAVNKDDVRQSYIALAVPKNALPVVGSFLDAMENDQIGKHLSELLGDFAQLEKIVTLLFDARRIPPVVAVTVKKKTVTVKKQSDTLKNEADQVTINPDQVKIKAWHRRRILEGSVVASGLAAYLDKVNCSLVFTRRSQLTQLAIACKALGGKLVAFPLEKSTVDGKSRVTVKNSPLIRENDLVRGTNALLCVTSVSEVCVLDRVRFDSTGTANTDTIVVSLATGRVTRQTDKFVLRTANARDLVGEEVKLRDRINYLWNPTADPQLGLVGQPSTPAVDPQQ